MRSLSFRQVALPLALLLSASSASAQVPETRWAAWLGCWSPVTEVGVGRTMTCVIPGASADAAELLIVSGDSVEQRSVVIADGSTRRIDAEGCVGNESARFSEDGSRVFLSGEVRCGNGATQTTSGVISISETGEWLDVHGVSVGEQHSLRVRRSRAAITGASLPAEIRAALANTGRSSGVARLAAARPLSLPRVHETAKSVHERVAEAWLLETSRDGSGLAPVDAKALARMEDDGISDRVIDVVVAISYPKHFQVSMTSAGAGEIAKVASTTSASAREVDRRAARGAYGDPFYYGLYGRQRCYHYGCYLYYSDSPYYYGLGGWNSYGGYGMYPGWGYGGPITIVVRPSEPGGGGGGGGGGSGSPGRVVKGRGYTSGGGGTEPAQPRSVESASTGTASSRGSGSSAGASSTGNSSPPPAPSEPARTAKPRNP